MRQRCNEVPLSRVSLGPPVLVGVVVWESNTKSYVSQRFRVAENLYETVLGLRQGSMHIGN